MRWPVDVMPVAPQGHNSNSNSNSKASVSVHGGGGNFSRKQRREVESEVQALAPFHTITHAWRGQLLGCTPAALHTCTQPPPYALIAAHTSPCSLPL